MGSLTLTQRREGNRAVLSLAGDLDLATVPVLRRAALDALGGAGCHVLELELSELTFLDSTGLGCWIELRNEADAHGQALQLVALPAVAARTVRLAGLASLFGLDAPR